MIDKPQYIIVAGINGAGKSTLYDTFPSLFDKTKRINADELLRTCKKYHVDMKIHAFEQGMEFNQVIEIVDGEVIHDYEIHFTDYQWECVCPKLGG